MKERYDSSSQGQILDRGDAVWLYNPQKKKRSDTQAGTQVAGAICGH